MPNHVTNIIIAQPRVLDALKSELSEVDFNNFREVPPNDDPTFTAEYSDLGSGLTGWGGVGYSPLDWQREVWGTKWNAYSIRRETISYSVYEKLVFDTAWTHPEPVIKWLFNQHPTDEIIHLYADEDTGYNCGFYFHTDEGDLLFKNREGAFDFAQLVQLGEFPESVTQVTGFQLN